MKWKLEEKTLMLSLYSDRLGGQEDSEMICSRNKERKVKRTETKERVRRRENGNGMISDEEKRKGRGGRRDEEEK